MSGLGMRRVVLGAAAALGLSTIAVADAAIRAGGPVPQPQPRRGREPVGDSLAYVKRPGPGWSAAQVKRLKRKRRNRLRAKGQFRKAVR